MGVKVETSNPYAHLKHDGVGKAWILPGVLLVFLALAASLSTSTADAVATECPQLAGSLINGFTCLVDVSRARAAILPLCAQLTIMSTIVYLSSNTARDIRYRAPLANVLRTIIGSLLLSGAEVALVQKMWSYVSWDSMSSSIFALASLALVRVLFGYAMCAISDYMFHRFVWHAHWAMKPTSLLFRAVRRHYVQHYVGHHKHCHDSDTAARMAQLHEKPMSDAKKLEIETNPRLTLEDVYVLQCSNHGLSVGAEDDARVVLGKWGCRLHTALMFLTMPSGTAVFVNVMYGSLLGVLVHCSLVGFLLYLTFHHDKYHAEVAMTREWAGTQYASGRGAGSVVARAVGRCLRSMWMSGEMDRTIRDHEKHHHCAKHCEEFFGLAPYSRFFVYPMWHSW